MCQLSFSSLKFIFCNFSPKCSHLLLARSFPSKTIKNLPLEPTRSRGFEVRGFHLSFYLPTLSFPSRLVWQSKVTPRAAFLGWLRLYLRFSSPMNLGWLFFLNKFFCNLLKKKKKNLFPTLFMDKVSFSSNQQIITIPSIQKWGSSSNS